MKTSERCLVDETGKEIRLEHRLGKWRSLRFAMAVITACFALLSVMYALFFPNWIFGLVLGDSSQNGSDFFRYGLLAPFNDYPRGAWLFIVIVAVLAVLFVQRLKAAIHQRWKPIFILSVVTVIITLLVVMATGRTRYNEAVKAKQEAPGNRLAHTWLMHPFESSRKGMVPDVAAFHYLDEQAISSMYSQIEPEWLEKERSFTQSSSSTGKAGVSSGPLSGELGTEGKNETHSVEQPPPLTPERKCKVLMQYAVKQLNVLAYSTAAEFQIALFWEVASNYTDRLPPESNVGDHVPLNKLEMDELKASSELQSDDTPATKKKIDQELAKQDSWSTLKSLLGRTNAFVFVLGHFDVIRSDGKLVLVHPFTQPDGTTGIAAQRFPTPIQFNVRVPAKSEISILDGKDSVEQLNVFGSIIAPLDKDGMVEVRPLAIY